MTIQVDLKLIGRGFLVWIGRHVIPAVLIGIGAYLFLVLPAERRAAKATKEAELAVASAAKQVGAVSGQLESERKLRAGLEGDLAKTADALKNASSRVRLLEHSTARVTVGGVIPLKPVESTAGVTTTGLSEFTEEYHRYTVHLLPPPPRIDRKELWEIALLVAEGPDGKTRFGKASLTEFDPVTKEVIPNDGTVSVDYKLEYAKERAPAPGPFHLRLVALGGSPGGGGIGGQVNPVSGFILTLGGVYSKSNGVSGVGGLGWRLKFPWFDSTLGLSIGAFYGKGGVVRVGGLGSVELTR